MKSSLIHFIIPPATPCDYTRAGNDSGPRSALYSVLLPPGQHNHDIAHRSAQSRCRPGQGVSQAAQEVLQGGERKVNYHSSFITISCTKSICFITFFGLSPTIGGRKFNRVYNAYQLIQKKFRDTYSSNNHS